MSSSFVLTGAHIVVFLNGVPYNELQGASFSIDYGESSIFGIDSLFPQEIAPSKIEVRGSFSGIRIKLSGGIQAKSLRPLFMDAATSPYISIRIQDRQSSEDILFIPKAKITRESHSIATKSTYKLSFDFVGMIPLMALDRA